MTTTEEELVRFVHGLVRGAAPPQRHYRALIEKVFVECTDHPNLVNMKAVLIATVVQTRDIVDGKGECRLFYQLLGELILMGDDHAFLHPFITEIIVKTVKSFDNNPPYGSWKDLKYLLNHLREVYGEPHLIKKPVFQFIVKLLAEQLTFDHKCTSAQITLAGKWAPREKSNRFGWQAPHIAVACYPTERSYTALRSYRQMLSSLNRRLDTVQVYQCARKWKEIDFNQHVTSRTFFTQRNAFVSASDINIDRLVCKNHYTNHLFECRHGQSLLKSQHIGVGELVRESEHGSPAADIHWNEIVRNQRPLNLVIPFVDTSAAVAGITREALHYAVGIGLMLAEKSSFGRRLITYSGRAVWVNLDGTTTLADMVKRIECVEVDANPEAAVKLFLEGINQSGIDKTTLSAYTLVFITMRTFTLHAEIKSLFEKEGIAMPHIVIWSVATDECVAQIQITTPRITYLSGYHLSAMHQINAKKKQINNRGNTPWNKLVDLMCSPRYSWIWCLI